MSPAQNARRGYCLQLGHVVAKNTWWVAVCPKHGEQAHLSYLGGSCSKCHHEALVAQGLVKGP